MKQVILITGITGFVGSHLADYILTRNDCILHGTKRWSSRLRNIKHNLDNITLHDCDITDYVSVRETLLKVQPDKIFHLAAQSYVSESWNMPNLYMNVNIMGTLNILEALRELEIYPKIHISGSGEEYGLVYPNEIPINENNPLRPVNPYAVSKAAQGLLGYEHFKSYSQRIVRTRAFNIEGARRDKVFALASFAHQIVMIERGKKMPIIEVGNISATRDFTHVKDMVEAYWLALEKGEPGELYCIGAHNIASIKEGLKYLISKSTVKGISIVEDPKRVRPTEVPLLESDSSKFMQRTKWEPKYNFEQIMDDTLEYWRGRCDC